jgi:hypothetical protein
MNFSRPNRSNVAHGVFSSSQDSNPTHLNRICRTAKKSYIPRFLKCSNKKSRKRLSVMSNVSSKHSSGLGKKATKLVHTVQKLQKRVWYPVSRRALKQQRDLPQILVTEETSNSSETFDLEAGTAGLALFDAPNGNTTDEWLPALSLNSTKLADWIPVPRPREDSVQPDSFSKNATAILQHPPLPSTLTHSHRTLATTPKQPRRASSVLLDLPTEITQFNISHLMAEATLRRLSPKTRVIVTCQNSLSAYKDMVQLARIWRRAVAGSPSAAIVKILDPLSRLSEVHARKLCTDVQQGLRAHELWGERANKLRESGEGSMCAAWWERFDAEMSALEAVVGIEDLQAQFKAVGAKFLKPAPLMEPRDPVIVTGGEAEQQAKVASTPKASDKTTRITAPPTSNPEKPYSNDDFLCPRTPPKVPCRRASAPGSLSKAKGPFECFVSEDPVVQACVAEGDVDGNALRVMNRLGRRNKQRRMPLPDEWRAPKT